MLLKAGLPLVEAIETLAQKERRTEFRTLLGRIAAVLREGQPFSAALEQQPAVFSPLYVATVRAAEDERRRARSRAMSPIRRSSRRSASAPSTPRSTR